MIKRLLPLLCAVVMIVGSSMNVLAKDNFPNGVKDNFVTYKANDTTWCAYTDGYIFIDHIDSLAVKNYTYFRLYMMEAGQWVLHSKDDNKSQGSFTRWAVSFEMINSNVNIYRSYDEKFNVNETDEYLFFHPALPVPLAAQAIQAAELPVVIANQAKIITIVAICCLALMVGLMVLVKKLRHFLS